jgi:hypothetical protein
MSSVKPDADGGSVMMLQIFIGAAVGAVFGFGWFRIAGSTGCRTGVCPLTSHPVVSTLYGMVVGGLIAASFH